MTDILTLLSLSEWLILSVVVNSMLYFFSIALYVLLDKKNARILQSHKHPVIRSDIYLSVCTVICNSAVMLIGVLLWKKQLVAVADHSSWFAVVFQVILLIVLMDLLMYLFHRLAHIPAVYAFLHKRHHEHIRTNCLSLFVLHPLEALGFGFILIAVLIVYTFSPVAVGIYLFINLVWGTLGHLNKEVFPKGMEQWLIGTTAFHNQHHLHEDKNFGFYTSIWDKIFRTLASGRKEVCVVNDNAKEV